MFTDFKNPVTVQSNSCVLNSIIPVLLVLQCGAGLQVAGGQATAPDEETLPHG